ncbi:MAG: DUF2723 domain-containing protein [candidate division Zixibacteria bacterium]|nr:DUF2723 domain-containing protein [candidate division Zixibacteria bacterium]
MTAIKTERFDRTNAFLASVVFLVSFIIYAMTVQHSFSFWDCGEFIACSYILGIPHPPGTPLFVLLGRVISLIPFVEDISHRINYLSVIGSALTAAFSYLLTVRIVGYFFGDARHEKLNRLIAYIGGLAGGFFVAFSNTNWANSVEAEVYGLALWLSVMIVWLTVRYFEQRGTTGGQLTLILIFYLAMVGIGIHMTVFLVVPVCALLVILRRGASVRDWTILSGFILYELLLIFVFSVSTSNAGRGSLMFYLFTIVGAIILFVLLYKKINWAILIAIGSLSTIMMSFSLYMKGLLVAVPLIILLAFLSKKYNFNLQWKAALAIILVGFIGMSVHAYIPIRSALNPRIDENNPSRGFRTFVNYLDRKQYGQTSMIDRMFHRRGELSNQFGRHPHMGFWSYFEEQYSSGRWGFVPFFILGIIGVLVAIRKRLEIGLPFFVLLIVSSVGLILYMNFADGVCYDAHTGDAYLEVRNRDYFFTPAFVFFGIAMGMGVAAVIQFLRDKIARGNPGLKKMVVYASSVLVLLPGISLAKNYHINDRSNNKIPYNYAANLLDTCKPNSILFTSGDNDTFPVWCIQEVYDYRKDVRVVNLSLLNTDWYVEQMKNRYDVPISLSDSQIVWYPYEVRPGLWAGRPLKPFYDRPRKRMTYLQANSWNGRMCKVQDMMVDEIVIENKWQNPIYFSSPPYAESPLKLRDHSTAVGLIYRLDREPSERLIDAEQGYDIMMNVYRYDGYESSDVYRNENATGVFLGYGVNAVRLYDEFMKQGQKDKAKDILKKIINVYPEYWQSYLLLGDLLKSEGDSAAPESLLVQLTDTLTSFVTSNEENLFYLQDLGLSKVELGKKRQDTTMINEGIKMLWKSFKMNPNNSYSFRKLISVLSSQRRLSDMQRAATIFANYKIHKNDPIVKQLLGLGNPMKPPVPPQGQ